MSNIKKYAVTITYKCNWNCRYCAVRNKYDYKDNLTHEQVLAKLETIEPNSTVTIFGGEPGLVERENLEKYVRILEEKNCELHLETNGTFIKNHPDLLGKFKEITYHCSCELDDDFIRIDHPNVKYMLVVHDDNVGKLEDYLKKNGDVDFYVVEATYPHEDMDGPTLSTKNKNMILTHFGKRMTKESINRFINGKNFDEIIFLT